MRYEILQDPTVTRLETLVNIKLKAGWRPQGGVAIVKIHYGDSGVGTCYSQAIILEEAAE